MCFGVAAKQRKDRKESEIFAFLAFFCGSSNFRIHFLPVWMIRDRIDAVLRGDSPGVSSMKSEGVFDQGMGIYT